MFLNRPTFIPVKDRLTDKVKLDPATGLPLFTMSESLIYVGIDGEEVRVPAEEESDMGSVPGPLRWRLNPHSSKWILPFRLHDHDYMHRRISRWKADLRLFYAAREHEVEFWDAFKAWALLRLFGWTHWHQTPKS